MLLKSKLNSFFLYALLCLSLLPFQLKAQDDPNAQYILIQSGELHSGGLQSETREIEIPIEVGLLRLQLSLQAGATIDYALITPLAKLLALTEPNISMTQNGDRRSLVMWDPRPGNWKIRLKGQGKFNLTVMAQGELYVCCAQFWGRNGVMALDRFQPRRGAKHQAQIYASGFNIQTIEFLAVNEHGKVIAPIKFRQGDLSNPSNFTLLVEIPDEPFRLMARGRDLSGKSYQRLIGALIRPGAGDPLNPQGDSLTGVIQLPQEWNKDFVQGEYRIVRAQVVSWSDEPLLSEKGSQIGLRLKYSVRFAADGSYGPVPQVYPERIGYGYTGALSLHVFKGSVEPAPEGVANLNQLFQGVRGLFKRDLVYQFTVDLIPNYVVFNQQTGEFCLQTKAYNQPGLRERFEREVMSQSRVRFRFAIPGTDLDGRQPSLTENSYLPGAWYQGYAKDGITECK